MTNFNGVFKTREACEKFEKAFEGLVKVAAELWKDGEVCLKDVTFVASIDSEGAVWDVESVDPETGDK